MGRGCGRVGWPRLRPGRGEAAAGLGCCGPCLRQESGRRCLAAGQRSKKHCPWQVSELKAQLGHDASRHVRLPMVSEAKDGLDECAVSLANELDQAFDIAQRLATRALEVEEALQAARIDAAQKLTELKATALTSDKLELVTDDGCPRAEDRDRAMAELNSEFEEAMSDKSELLSLIQQRVMDSNDSRSMLKERIDVMSHSPSRSRFQLLFQNASLRLENIELNARAKMRERLMTQLFSMHQIGCGAFELASSSYSVELQVLPNPPNPACMSPSRLSPCPFFVLPLLFCHYCFAIIVLPLIRSSR